MIRIAELKLPLDYTEAQLLRETARLLKLRPEDIVSCNLTRRAVDARKKQDVHFRLTVDVTVRGEEQAIVRRCHNPQITCCVPSVYVPPSASARRPCCRPVVVGSGPAGLFAALTLAQAGVPPLVLERGRDVDTRQADVQRFFATGVLNPASNVQFGEGGAGTFSDGKLNTGVKDIRCRYVLEEFVRCGAPADILWQAKPHIGTDKLRETVKGMRRRIQELGGEVRFGCRLSDIIVKGNCLTGIVIETADGTEQLPADRLILAIGHSARDTFAMLHQHGVAMQPKPFAVGVRIEHPRPMIDRSQYGEAAGHPALGAASYKLICHLPDGRSVYTFCMCPGGVVVAAASEPGGVVVNGMSTHARDAENSNSALLVGVTPADFPSAHPLAGIEFQRQMEQAAFALGGRNYQAPAQLVGDFMADRASTKRGDVTPSYQPGIAFGDLRECLPPFVAQSLKMALPYFGKQLAGFDRPDAILTGVETRSSSPVRIVRNADGQASLSGLYPCGEGAGYAGGITSAAVDGIRCAEWLLRTL